MAKFVPFLGNISGKLKSIVFAYNKSGAYIRAWRASTKPFSVDQIRSQAIFTAAVTSWHALTDTMKNQWNYFATNFFHAKHPVSGTSYSGYNAFVSLNNAAANLNTKAVIAQFSDPITATFTSSFFQNTQTPPAGPMSAQIKDSAGLALNLLLTACQLSITDGLFTADFSFDRSVPIGTGTDGINFSDAISNQKVGLVIYGSDPAVQMSEFVTNPEFSVLAAALPIGQVENWSNSSVMQLGIGRSITNPDRKVEYTPGQIIQAKAFLASEAGELMPLNAIKFTVTT